MKELPEYQGNHDIDLVDILVVLIKRKWIIIGFVLTAFIFSGLNVIIKNIKYTQEGNNIIDAQGGNENQKYKSSVIITLPQTFSINSNNFLAPVTSRVDIILNAIRDELNLKSYKKINSEFEYYYNYEVNFEKDQIEQSLIKISIEGYKQEIIQAISSLYLLYSNYENEINEKNQTYFQLAQNTLQRSIESKKKVLDKYIIILDQEELKKLPLGTTIVNQIPTLISEISIFERTYELNKSAKLLNGKFILLKTQKEIIINKDNIANIDHYIEDIEKGPVKSMKRQMLPVIISVFLAFFVGVFFAFIVEFFSREDIKNRFKEIKEK